MSQYISITFMFIYFITINILITVSINISNNRSFQISGSNKSLILNKNIDSNSYYYVEEELIVSNSTNVNYSRTSSTCNSESDCSNYSPRNLLLICCSNQCLNYNDPECKGHYKAKCSDESECVKIRGTCRRDEFPYPSKQCLCEAGYRYENQICIESYNYDPNKAMQIYKITMIFASCCLALILIIFLVCILKKSYCPSSRRIVPLDNNIPDIFTLFPHVGNYDGGPLGDGTQPPFEKPPTYDETIQLMREEIGIPPPAYRGNYSPNSSNPSTPEMCSRVVITRPTLMTVNEESNNLSLSSTDSSDLLDVSVAGPSGCQGIINQAFSHK